MDTTKRGKRCVVVALVALMLALGAADGAEQGAAKTLSGMDSETEVIE